MSGFQKFLTKRERHSRYSKHFREEVQQSPCPSSLLGILLTAILSLKTSNILSRPLFRGFFSSQSTSEDGNGNQKKVRGARMTAIVRKETHKPVTRLNISNVASHKLELPI